MLMVFARRILLSCALLALVRADEDVYIDGALSAGWEDWSWSSVINWAATDIVEGSSSVSVNSSAYGALSMYAETPFANSFAGLQFDILGDQPDVSLDLESTTDSGSISSIPVASMTSVSINSSAWTTVLLDFSNLPPSGSVLGNDSWNRIDFQAGGNGAVYHLDNIILVTSIVVTPQFLSAEPLTNNIVAVTTAGAVDLSTVKVTLNNATVGIASMSTYVPPDTPSQSITYLVLDSSFVPGSLTITAGNTTFSHILPPTSYGAITVGNNYSISPLIYGVNFPSDAAYIQQLGVTISRWGGNAVTAYNPFLDVTNAGSDWYFENRVGGDGSVDDWVGWVSGAGSETLVTIPALDWVSKDSTSYSYPISVYPDQSGFDPYNGVSGSGLFPNGSYVTPVPPQSNVYTPWNTSLAITWLQSMTNKPSIVTIDNEIEIASNTHQDMHPIPVDYDEELARVIATATAAKTAIPGIKVAAPSTCAWWYYWTSEVGFTDNAAHNNMDFLPWFLAQMKAHDTSTGTRLLDYLDIHYYFAADTSADDAASKALLLRETASFWDPDYIDESWIGEDTPQNHQPNANAVWLIPRMQELIAQFYPGTKLSISEWSSSADTDITGGLVTVDALGIFGVNKLDSATYWATPDAKGPVGLAYWLYRGSGVFFGPNSAQVNMAERNEGILGVYAATGPEAGAKLSVVIVNKDVNHVGLYIANIPTGNYFLRHFGGDAGVAKFQTNITMKDTTYVVVPSYTAIFLQQL